MDYSIEAQQRVLEGLGKQYRTEYDSFPRNAASAPPNGFFLDNGMFGSVDAELLYAMVRKHKPARVVEVGAGWSTYLITEALEKNAAQGHPSQHIVVDPVAPGFVYEIPGIELIREKLQDTAVLADLRPGDFLVADTSHVFVPGHEIDLILQTMEKLVGVWVHFHDMFLPEGYPEQWADRHYDEQEHVESFLLEHPEWQIVLAANYLHTQASSLLSENIKSYAPARPIGPGSLWLRVEPPVAEIVADAFIGPVMEPEATHKFVSNRNGKQCLVPGCRKGPDNKVHREQA